MIQSWGWHKPGDRGDAVAGSLEFQSIRAYKNSRMVGVPMNMPLKNSQTRIADFLRLRELGLLEKSGDFFPSVHYPPITMYPETSDDALFAGYTPPADGLFDVYIHIPFCLQRCLFCHYPVKLGNDQVREKDRYLSAMDKEMALYCARLGLDRVTVRSILVGGAPLPSCLRSSSDGFSHPLRLISISRLLPSSVTMWTRIPCWARKAGNGSTS